MVFSVLSTNGLGNAPSPPPWVTLKTSASFRAIIWAVDFGIVVGNFNVEAMGAASRRLLENLRFRRFGC